MSINLSQLRLRPLEPAVEADLDTYEQTLADYQAGRVDDEVFRVFRLTNGIYGQRQGGTNQMVRVKVPHGRLTPEQLEMLAYVADAYSRGWGHLTTRQNVQFHFVDLGQTPEVLRLLASVGLTTREACGDTVRNVAGCHLAGACPLEVLDITPWAEATTRWFLRNPLAQRLPRKFKINFSGCATDCGQAMFNDVGVVAVMRPLPDGTTEAGFRVFIAGGLGTTPHPAQALEEFTSREDLMPTIEAVLRTFDHYGNRDKKLRARMKWLVDTMGIDELRERIVKERRFLRASATWPGGIPEVVRDRGDEPAGGTPVTGDLSGGIGTGTGSGQPVALGATDPFRRWEQANVVRGVANGTVSAVAHAPLGDLTAEQLRGLADIQRDFDSDVRITNRQNLVLRADGCRPARRLRPARRRRHGGARGRAGARRGRMPGRRHLQPGRNAVAWPRGGDRRVARGGRSRGDRGRARQHLGLHQLVRPAPRRRHRLLRRRAARPRHLGTRLSDAPRWPPRRHAGRLRREGHEAPGQARSRGGRARRRALRGRARGRGGVRSLAGPLRRCPGGRRDPRRPRRSSRPRRRTRSLR
ncbi:MAG: nitrite/sulfite reductase [Acidimicrobiia bacterium]|nr:nitrite/sulfite reductase [Acidimicrobiia bacterium]